MLAAFSMQDLIEILIICIRCLPKHFIDNIKITLLGVRFSLSIIYLIPDYAYVLVDGQKTPIPVPKKIIKSEYLENAEKNVKTREGTLSRASSSGSSAEIVNKSDVATDFTGFPQNAQNPANEVAKESSPTASETTKSIAQSKSELLVNLEQSVVQENVETGEMISHCSAAGTCFSEDIPSMQRSSRVFVFPEDCPGYEVLPSVTVSSK